MNKLRSYDLETGRIVWESEGVDDESRSRRRLRTTAWCSSTSGFRGNSLNAIRLADAQRRHHGTPAHRVDARSRHALRAVAAPLRRHPLFAEDELRHPVRPSTRRPASRTISCSGSTACPTSSPRRSARRDASTSPGRDGTTIVIKHGPTYEVLAKNTLDDGFDASPALVDNEIYLRGYTYLYAIGAP